MVAKGWGGKWGVTNKAYGVSSGHDENVMELVGGDGCTNASVGVWEVSTQVFYSVFLSYSQENSHIKVSYEFSFW